MRPLPLSVPKPLVTVAGKPILTHILDALPKEISEVVLVVGYKKEMIVEAFGSSYKGRKITYVVQEKVEGTLKALELARPHISGKFLVMNADDIHGPDALSTALTHPLALIVSPHPEPEKFGVVRLSEKGTLLEILEKPEHPPTNLVSTGAMVLDERIFAYQVPVSGVGEFFLPDALQMLARDTEVAIVEQSLWIPLGRPEDIPKAEEQLQSVQQIEL